METSWQAKRNSWGLKETLKNNPFINAYTRNNLNQNVTIYEKSLKSLAKEDSTNRSYYESRLQQEQQKAGLSKKNITNSIDFLWKLKSKNYGY